MCPLRAQCPAAGRGSQLPSALVTQTSATGWVCWCKYQTALSVHHPALLCAWPLALPAVAPTLLSPHCCVCGVPELCSALLPQPTGEHSCSEPSFGLRFSLPTKIQGGLAAYRKEMKFPLPLTRRNCRLQAVCCSCLALQCWSQAVKHAASPAVAWQLHFNAAMGAFSQVQLQWEWDLDCYQQGNSSVGRGQAAPSLILRCWHPAPGSQTPQRLSQKQFSLL